MNKSQRMPNIDSDIPENAIRVYGQDDNAMDDFPVLKAFQQYVDAEQSKAHKRMVTLGIFFSLLMVVVVAIFMVLLVIIYSRNQSLNDRNQTLNDRLVDFAMRERGGNVNIPQYSPIVVQPSVATPQSTDGANLAIINELKDQVENLKNKLNENEKKAAEEAKKPRKPTPEELRLKKLLEEEKAKNSAERERKHQEELEKYWREHYPDIYEKKNVDADKNKEAELENKLKKRDSKLDAALDDLNLDDKRFDEDGLYFYDEKSNDRTDQSTSQNNVTNTIEKKDCSISIDINGSSSDWLIPND